MASKYGKQFTTRDVRHLGKALLDVADKYPTKFLTERDFYPLVLAYLHGRVPQVAPEHATEDGGKIDFRIGGSNPSVLEIAVAPRMLRDAKAKRVVFPGHQAATQLYASQNKTELTKLGAVPQSRAKMRYLLLLDFRSIFKNKEALRDDYKPKAPKLENPVKVIYVSRRSNFDVTLRKAAT